MWLDLLGLFVIVCFALLGAARGALRTALRLLAIGGAYALAVLLAPGVASVLEGTTSLPVWLALPIAGIGVFIAAYMLLGGVCLALGWLERRWRGDYPRTLLDRTGGAIFGGLRGTAIVLLVGWLVLWLDAFRVTTDTAYVPPVGDSVVASATGAVVSAGAQMALGSEDPAGRVAARMMAQPAAAASGLKRLMENPRIEALQEDELFWSYASHGAYDAALNQGSFLSITYDSTLRGELADLGLVSPEAASDPQLFRSAAREVLVEIGPRLRNLQDDPRIHALADDPEVRRALASGDTIALLRHPGFRRLVSQVTATSTSE